MVSLCYNRGVGTANPGLHLIVKGHDVTPLQEIITFCVCGRPNCTVPYGLCHCGCGGQTSLATENNASKRKVKGLRLRYLPMHRGYGVMRAKKAEIKQRKFKAIDFSVTNSDVLRFFEKVDKTPGHGPNDDCWIWLAGSTKKGYGLFGFGNANQFLAHRVSFFIANGHLPTDMLICHECDNPPCVNPTHLFPGTTTDNMNDCANKGRTGTNGLRGEDMPDNKLTSRQVLEMREMYWSIEKGYEDIGRKYGVCGSTVINILRRKTWKHL